MAAPFGFSHTRCMSLRHRYVRYSRHIPGAMWLPRSRPSTTPGPWSRILKYSLSCVFAASISCRCFERLSRFDTAGDLRWVATRGSETADFALEAVDPPFVSGTINLEGINSRLLLNAEYGHARSTSRLISMYCDGRHRSIQSFITR